MKISVVRVALYVAFGTAALDVTAEEVDWLPRLGPLTCEQETEIELVSQDLSLLEQRTMSIGGQTFSVFDAKAKFLLKNSSLAKKKPTALMSLCTVLDTHPNVSLCPIDALDLKLAVDDRPVTDFHVVRQGQTVYARFPIKFNAKTRHEVTATFRLPEQPYRRSVSDRKRPYTVFEFFLSDSVKWKGKIASTRISVKMPYRATAFNTHLLTTDKGFRYKNRVAYVEKRRLDVDNVENATILVSAPSFEEKVKAARKKVKALPTMLKRRLRLVDLLSQYPGAFGELSEHLDIIFRLAQKDWDAPARRHAVELYTRFLSEALRFEGGGGQCEDTLCIENEALRRSTSLLCTDDVNCIDAGMKRFSDCCEPRGKDVSSVASEAPVLPNEEAGASARKPAAPPKKKPEQSVVAKYFEYFVAHWPIFLAIFIVMGWIGVASKTRNKQKMKELE